MHFGCHQASLNWFANAFNYKPDINNICAFQDCWLKMLNDFKNAVGTLSLLVWTMWFIWKARNAFFSMKKIKIQ